MLIQKYTTSWETDFLIIKYEIENALKEVQFSIEHVGSTSVPKLDSKPIIDIDIIYWKQEDFIKIKFELENIGYYHNGNQGIEDREVFKRKGELFNKTLDTIQHHLYVCPFNSNSLRRHILTRNHLRKNELAREKYQMLKYKLAEKANQNRKVYAALKEIYVNSFIDSIIEQEQN
jgi:GrpB-like predicted nucleotidyltransferase (UPF0157 family)